MEASARDLHCLKDLLKGKTCTLFRQMGLLLWHDRCILDMTFFLLSGYNVMHKHNSEMNKLLSGGGGGGGGFDKIVVATCNALPWNVLRNLMQCNAM